MIDNRMIANLGRLVPGATSVSWSGVVAAKERVARSSGLNRYCTTGAKFAVANGDLSLHVQVQTTPMTDAGTGIPPSAYARHT